MAKAEINGVYTLECFRNGTKMWSETAENLTTNEGLDRLLNVNFHGATQIATWYCGLVESDTTAAAAMTYDVPVFTECTAYDEATRPEYVEAESTARSTTNSANKAVFTMSATKTIYGAFLTSVATKGDHAAGANNVLHSYAKLGSSRSTVDNDVLNLTYTETAADDGV
ncbi:MAG: hypothetical protein WC657_07020 [Candidatus Paceibacterota bacterium]|jgi:anthranilate phosphoribosyltransferase